MATNPTFRYAKMAEDDLFNSFSPDNQDAFDDNFNGDSTLDSRFSTQTKEISQTKKRQVKPKVSSEWSDNEIYTLISCVEGLPILWNANDEKYRNKIERQSAWKQMSEIDFDNKFTVNELMAKWSNLRIQYRSYFAKYRKNKSGQGANEQVKWKFYGAMDFISQAGEQQTFTTVSNLVNADERSPIDQNMTSTPQISKRRRLSQSSSVTATSSSSSAAHIVAEGMKDAVKQLKEQRQQREDEFDAFGKYVASELRSLSNPTSAQRVRFKVARYLMDCIELENQPTIKTEIENLSESSLHCW